MLPAEDTASELERQWPLRPGPGYRCDPRHDPWLIDRVRPRDGAPPLPIAPFRPGEPLTRVCDHCYAVAGQHFSGCPTEPTRNP